MKKVLFSTTALAAFGALMFSAGDVMAASKAKPMKIGVGGYFKTIVGFGTNSGSFESTSGTTNLDRAGYEAFNIIGDSEIYFTGSTKLDNGVAVNLTIQLETDQVDSAIIDESYLKFTGGFGDIRIGSVAPAGVTLGHNAPQAGPYILRGGSTNNHTVAPAAFTGLTPTPQGVGGDANKLVYISPKFADAIYIGASYTPSNTDSNAAPATGGNDGTETQLYEGMISYESKVGTTDLKFDVGYSETHGDANSSFSNWRTGINLGFGGLTLGGAYKDQDNIDDGKNGTEDNDEQTVYQIGASYKMAGGVTASIGYVHGEQPLSSTTGDDEIEKWNIGANYAVGPGVTFYGGIYYSEFNNESSADADNNDGWAAIGALKVAF